ncbi:MAG TPA: polysaccharide pyruvyl transferase family protein [Roseiflexaceae bacterium]|nr:polysaccharide pyruvyl transferase family protein [Roseiflexaceae bacterium]
MNILLINQQSTQNRGDLAIYQATLRLLEATFPDARIMLTFYDETSAAADLPGYPIYQSLDRWAFTVDAAGRVHFAPRLQRLLDLLRLLLCCLVFRLSGRMPRLFKNPARQATLDAFAAADLVLACGGGYIYDTDVPLGRVARLISFLTWGCFLLGNTLFAVALGKPLVLLPQSIGPLHDPVRLAVVRWIVRHARLSCVREARSEALLQQLAAQRQILALPDLAFGFVGEASAAGRALLDRAGLPLVKASFCVGMTAIDWGGQQPTFVAQAAYEQSLLACIDHITAAGGAVVLFGQCGNAMSVWDDRAMNRRLRECARQPARIILIDELPSPALLQAAYGCMDFFIGTRMHSVILALNAGTPAIAVGYLHKSVGMMEQIGLANYCHDIEHLEPTTLIAAFEQLRAAPAQPQAQAYIALARRRHQALGALLYSIAVAAR